MKRLFFDKGGELRLLVGMPLAVVAVILFAWTLSWFVCLLPWPV